MAAHPKHQIGPRIARFTEELRIDIEFDAKEDAKKAAKEQGVPLTKFARNALRDAVQRHKEFMADKSPGARVLRSILRAKS